MFIIIPMAVPRHSGPNGMCPANGSRIVRHRRARSGKMHVATIRRLRRAASSTALAHPDFRQRDAAQCVPQQTALKAMPSALFQSSFTKDPHFATARSSRSLNSSKIACADGSANDPRFHNTLSSSRTCRARVTARMASVEQGFDWHDLRSLGCGSSHPGDARFLNSRRELSVTPLAIHQQLRVRLAPPRVPCRRERGARHLRRERACLPHHSFQPRRSTRAGATHPSDNAS